MIKYSVELHAIVDAAPDAALLAAAAARDY